MQAINPTKRRPLARCCDSDGYYKAVPTISYDPSHGVPPVFGYTVGRDCGCEPRFVAHDWRRGHAEFKEVSK